jgi:hypothetical protein
MYLDPSEGKAGAFLETVYGAATSGALQVDPSTGETTLKFLNEVQSLAAKALGQVNQVSVKTPLGGGFANDIGAFNQGLAIGGPNPAQEVLARFTAEIELLKEAVAKSMESYRRTDSGNAATMARAGAGR